MDISFHFANASFKVAYSYSLLQHLSKDDARKTISQISRVLEPSLRLFPD